MGCQPETHQLLISWKNSSSEQLVAKYNPYWQHNQDKNYFGFIPKQSTALILGTFPIPEQTTTGFFYHSEANSFWPILLTVGGYRLEALDDKLTWLCNRGVAISDILYQAKRKDANARADKNLTCVQYNNVFKILEDNPSAEYF